MPFADGMNNPALIVAVPLGLILLALVSMAGCRSQKRPSDGAPRPAWELFCISNVVAVVVFLASLTYLLDFWIKQTHAHDHTHTHTHAAGWVFAQPVFLASVVGVLGSLLYFFAFFGVVFAHQDVEAAAEEGRRARSDAHTRTPPRDVDFDVIIAGAGTVGASLAAVLAREGKKVLLIERTMAQKPSIVGELMQPGGIRALERMGLAQAAKTAAVDPVTVHGYVCVTPHTSTDNDLVLTYPSHDPTSAREYFGLLDKDPRAVRRHATYGDASGSASPRAGRSDVDAGGENVCPVTGADLQPRGRSFHNTRFVHQLRRLAHAEPNVSMHWGAVSRLVCVRDAGAVAHLRTSASAPRFAGFDEQGRPLETPKPSDESLLHSSVSVKAADVSVPKGASPDEVIGVAWKDEWGVERVATARLTVAADGMYSTTRKALHTTDYQVISHFAGLILHHDAHMPPLPYPNRGHVIMADPSPVLLYQISSTETRVLVDIPGELPSSEDGSLRRHFVEVVAPQLPACVRPSFIEAANTQTPIVMPNRFLPAVAPTKRGALLLGDSWNMRHPLTGGGMTVALRDVEALHQRLRGLDLRTCPDSVLDAAIGQFQEDRKLHASTINILAVALYRVFSKPAQDDGTRARLRAACIDYLSLGGACTAGPVGLLSGLTPKPEVLIAHFFAVAVHAMRRALLPFPTPMKLRQGYDLLHVACVIIMPLIVADKVPVMSSPVVASLIDLLFPWKKVDMLSL